MKQMTFDESYSNNTYDPYRINPTSKTIPRPMTMKMIPHE